MAYSSVRVQFEIGHEASVRTKKTPEGFTHDWEVFVRGADNTDIQCFVDKVVFHLHETFPKPRRVIKDPPYLVKESGYAGFVLPIDVYLKNKEEPKKISFQYDLQLQPSGPPISRVLREPRLFQNPSEDFRRKLIRGGGVGVDTPTESHGEESKFLTSLSGNKSKAIESPIKKPKPEPVLNDSFAELFGTPIRRIVEPKKLSDAPKKLTESELLKNKKKSKYGSFRDDKESIRDREKNSDKIKERERSKERPSKRLPSPPLPVLQTLKSKDEHKKHEEKRREEHDDKKRKKEEREKKEKTKDISKQVEKEYKKDKRESKESDQKKKLGMNKTYDIIKVNYERHNNEAADKEKEKHKHRHKRKEKEKCKNKDKHRKEKDKSEKESREREKDKLTKRKQEEAVEREEKMRRKSRSPVPIKKKPLNALLDELGSSDSASPLSEDETTPSFKSLSKPQAKIVPDTKPQPTAGSNTVKAQGTSLNAFPEQSRMDKDADKSSISSVNLIKSKKQKSSTKKSRKISRELDRRKIKEESRGDSSSSEKEENNGEDFDEEDEDEEEEVVEVARSVREEKEGRTEKEGIDDGKPKSNRENKKRKRDREEEKHQKTKKTENPEKNMASPDFADGIDDIRKMEKFTKEYVAELRDLQQRIMSLEDNAELQKVVKVIAETGQYEITKKTFDFDLCALDLDTVKRLQEFFLPT